MTVEIKSPIYLAARYSRRAELIAYRGQLRAAGHAVVARWLDGDYPTDEAGLSAEAPMPERARVSSEDLSDVLTACTVISFTETPRSAPGRGGRHVEFGVALATEAFCVVVGPRENVFHCLPRVAWFADWNALASAWGLDAAVDAAGRRGE